MVFVAPGELERRFLPAPALQLGEALVRVRCCTICESDRRTFRGEREAPCPSILGHEIVGEVVETRGEVFDAAGDLLPIGARVVWALVAACGACAMCDVGLPQKCDEGWKYGHAPLGGARPLSGGFADLCVLKAGTAIFRVPEGVPDAWAAVATCAGATAQAVVAAGPEPRGSSVLVLGAGMLGVLTLAELSERGARSFLREPDEGRARRTCEWLPSVTVVDGKDLAGRASGLPRRGFDVVFELSGHPRAQTDALHAAALGGTVVLAGAVAPLPQLEVSADFIVRRALTVRGVHNYHPRHLEAALARLPLELDGAGLFSAPISWGDLREALMHNVADLRVPVVPE